MNKVWYNKLGKNIKKLRLENNLTQEDLAEIAGINAKFEGRIERALSKPSLDTVFKIAKALKIKPEKFFEFD